MTPHFFLAFDCYDANIKSIAEALSWNITIPKSFHVTLKFLGQIDNIDEVTQKLKQVSFSPITVSTSHFGVFPSEKFVRIAWLSVEPQAQLIQLNKEISNLLPNIKDVHEYIPHITLARVRQHPGEENVKAFLKHDVPHFSWTWEKVILYSSVLLSSGPSYKKIADF